MISSIPLREDALNACPTARDGRIPAHWAGMRVDQALARAFPEFSRARLQRWLRGGAILVDGRCPRPSERVVGNERLELTIVPEAEGAWEAQALPLNVVYADDHVLVVDKPPGQVVHPGAGNASGTLLNALLHHDRRLAMVPRAGIVHRLDKDTSGLLVVARTLAAHHALVNALRRREVKREYLAVVEGLPPPRGEIDAPIGRDPRLRTRMAVVAGGRAAHTEYRVVESYEAHALLRVRLGTGRTHQIRVHLAHLGFPLAGDPLYRARRRTRQSRSGEVARALEALGRQALHATELGIRHPLTEASLAWNSPAPPDLEGFLDALRTDSAARRAAGSSACR